MSNEAWFVMEKTVTSSHWAPARYAYEQTEKGPDGARKKFKAKPILIAKEHRHLTLTALQTEYDSPAVDDRPAQA